MKNKKYHTVRTNLKYNSKIVRRGKVNSPNTQILDNTLSWLGTDTTQILDNTLSWLGTDTSINCS